MGHSESKTRCRFEGKVRQNNRPVQNVARNFHLSRAMTRSTITLMSTINFQELQQNTEKLFDRVEAGESFVLLRGGRPVAELRPVESVRQTPRPIGLCAGTFTARKLPPTAANRPRYRHSSHRRGGNVTFGRACVSSPRPIRSNVSRTSFTVRSGNRDG